MKRNVILLLLIVFATLSHAQTLQWEEVATGVWKATFGTPAAYNLLSASGAQPNKTALANMGNAELTVDKSLIKAEMVNGLVYLRFPLERAEQIFGLGLHFRTVHQRGRIMTLRTDHYGGVDNGRTHAPVPFYVSSRGYGVLINSAEYITVYVGTGVRQDSRTPPAVRDRNTDRDWTSRPYSDIVEVKIPATGVEIYLFAGPTPLDAVRRHNLFSGGGPLPPRWGLGFTQRVHRLYTAEQVIEEANEFYRRGFPLDFIGLEPGWMTHSYPSSIEWDLRRFPDPPAFVQTLLDKNIRLNLWINPYISPCASIYEELKPYTGTHTVWHGIVPDLNHPRGREIFANHLYHGKIDIGVSGYKIDEVDGHDRWLWPDVASFPSGVSAINMRQTFGMLVMGVLEEQFRQRNQRTFGLTRSNNAGGVRFPFVLYNDYYDHRHYIIALINSGFNGVLWTPEVRGSRNAEEWLRRIQTVVFSPMAMINAWSAGTKPWTFPEVTDYVRYFANLRMQLMPYFYSEFAKYHFKGTPPFRAMALQEGVTIGREINDQYMAGEFLLVAPMFTGETSREVILPAGRWYDFYTGEFAGENETITVTPGLSRIPVFAKDGAIIPMMEPRLRAPASGERIDLVVRHYGSSPGRFMLYDDDGETFDFEKGIYSWREITVTRNRRGQLEGSISRAERGMPDNIGNVRFEFMTR